MLLCETASTKDDAMDVLAVFTSQARGCGIPLSIHRHSLPPEIPAQKLYELAPLVTDVSPGAVEGLVVIGADKVPDESLRRIRRLTRGHPIPTTAYGTFETEQERISATSRLAYALNAEPRICEIREIPGFPSSSAPVFSCRLDRVAAPKPRVVFVLPKIDTPGALGAVRALAASQIFDVALVTDGKSKADWVGKLDGHVPVWHLGELTPRSFATRFDIALLCEKPMQWYRYQSFVANLVGTGAALVDATEAGHWSGLPDGVIRGSLDGASLLSWLRHDILPSLADLAEAQSRSKLRALLAPPPEIARAAASAEPAPRRSREARGPGAGRIVFMPTNGVGLGHAKRCSQIARALYTPRRAVFAAFPSCLQLLNNAGFDAMPLVSKTPHRGSNTNDLVNHARLDALCSGASGLVFDGGFVFESVMHTAADNRIPSVWIRRGLWQEAQNNAIAMDRSKIFDRIIVPTEAFHELNNGAHTARNVIEVGPVVQRIETTDEEIAALRHSVQDRVGMEGRQLVVTMLGGGVAADRKAQINAICTHLAARPEVMNLLVIWPTAVADPAWFCHPNTAVVQSYHASALIAAADLFISAAGYNSFHEAIYGGIPTIFIPQMAAYMDDQRARAQAASDRGLSLLVEPWETLRLTRVIDECLEGQAGELRQKLRGVNLPAIGNKAAARAIEEICQ